MSNYVVTFVDGTVKTFQAKDDQVTKGVIIFPLENERAILYPLHNIFSVEVEVRD